MSVPFPIANLLFIARVPALEVCHRVISADLLSNAWLVVLNFRVAGMPPNRFGSATPPGFDMEVRGLLSGRGDILTSSLGAF